MPPEPPVPSAWLTSVAIGLVVAVPTAIVAAPRAQRLVRYLTGGPPQPWEATDQTVDVAGAATR